MYGMVVLFLQLGCACFVYVVILIQYNGVHFNVFKFVLWCPSAAQRNKLRSSFEVGADVLILWRRTLQEVQSAVCETLHEKLPDACSQIQIRENRLTGCYAFIFYIEGCRNVNCLGKKRHIKKPKTFQGMSLLEETLEGKWFLEETLVGSCFYKKR